MAEATAPTKPSYLKHRWLGYVLVTVLVPMAMWSFVTTLAFDTAAAKVERTTALIQGLNEAYKSYVADNGALPQDLDNRHLYDVISGVGARNYYMTFNSRDVNASRELVDAWGTPLHVSRLADSNVRIESAGPDGKFGTSDDIANQ
jgi:hypothetical protein